VSAVFRSKGKSPTGNPEEDEFDAEITYRDGTTQRGPVGRSYAAGAQAEWGDAVRIEDEAPIPEPMPLPQQPAPSAYAVALERQRAGKPPVGRAALMDDDVAARPAFKPMSPEEASKADFGVEGFLERLRNAGEASPTAARILAKAGPKPPPTVDVARPGVAALSDVRPISAPAVANEQEGTVTRASVPQEAPPTSSVGDAEFAAAQGQSRDMRLAAALGRAGAMANEAISGARFDRGAYDGMEASANAPVAELLARREADRRKRLEDPTSPESRRFQQGVSKALGGVYSPEEIAEMTAADEPFVARYGEMRSRLDERRAMLERDDARRAEDVAFREREAAANRSDRAAARAASAEERGLRREEMQALLGQKQQEREAVRSEQQVERLAKEYSDTGAPGFLQQFQTVKGIMEKYPDDLPGFGPVAGRLPDAVVSDDGVRLRQSIGQMLAEYRKGVTGAGMSDSERAEYNRITGLLESGTEDRVRLGVDTLKGAMDARVRALAAGKRPDAVQTYAERNPVFREQATSPQPVPAPSSGERKQYSPSRNMTRVLDAQGNVLRMEQGDTRGR
jgi:hypothetical protein